MREDILIKNIKQYLKYARIAHEEEDYNTSLVLFFKTLTAICDLKIFRDKRIIPSNHAHRFRILENEYPAIYKILDRDFPYYTDTYELEIKKETAELVKKDAEKLLKEVGGEDW